MSGWSAVIYQLLLLCSFYCFSIAASPSCSLLLVSCRRNAASGRARTGPNCWRKQRLTVAGYYSIQRRRCDTGVILVCSAFVSLGARVVQRKGEFWLVLLLSCRLWHCCFATPPSPAECGGSNSRDTGADCAMLQCNTMLTLMCSSCSCSLESRCFSCFSPNPSTRPSRCCQMSLLWLECECSLEGRSTAIAAGTLC